MTDLIKSLQAYPGFCEEMKMLVIFSHPYTNHLPVMCRITMLMSEDNRIFYGWWILLAATIGLAGPGLISLYKEEEPAEFSAAWNCRR